MKNRTFMDMAPRVSPRERGASLIVVMLLLIIVSVLGVGGAQIAMMAERGSRNDRDMQVAWQAAEAALMDAEFDIHGPGTASRKATFTDMHNTNEFVSGCGTTGTVKGLCALAETGKPAWLLADFTNDDNDAPSTAFGDFTGRTFAAGNVGVQPAKVPRYIIEPISDPLNRDKTFDKPPTFIYRVTAMGFGPRDDIQAVTQILYRD